MCSMMRNQKLKTLDDFDEFHPSNVGKDSTNYESMFSADSLKNQLYKADQFFEEEGTPDDATVNAASVHLEDKALQWHTIFIEMRT